MWLGMNTDDIRALTRQYYRLLLSEDLQGHGAKIQAVYGEPQFKDEFVHAFATLLQ